MDSKDENVELMKEAIKRFLEEERQNKQPSHGDSFSQGGAGGGGDDKEEDRRLLSRLLSQLESFKSSGAHQKPEALTKVGEATSSSADGESAANIEGGGGGKEDGGDGGGSEIDKEEIVKELNKVKKQNTITHCLLSIMIVLTVAWQASEVTMLLKFKHGLTHPFRCVGEMFSGKGKDSDERKSEAPVLPPIKVPELLPRLELPDITFTGEKR